MTTGNGGARPRRPGPSGPVTGSPAARRAVLTVRYAVLSVLAVVFLVPFYLMLRTGLSPNSAIADPSFSFFPAHPQWGNVTAVLGDPAYRHALADSAVIAVLATGGQVVLGALAGYGLARIPNRAARPLFAVVLTTLLIPAATTFLPNFVIVVQFGWVGSLRGLIVPTLFSAFNVFLFRQYFLGFPKELEEAGRIDGLGHVGTFARIVVPNSLPFAAALTVLGFVASWNAFLWPLVVAGTSSTTTVQVYLSSFLTAQTFDYSGLFMAALISLVPLLVVFFVLQRYLVRGVTETGIGG